MNKAKKINIPKILLVVMLIGSLLGVHVMEVMAVATDEAIVEVSTYEELVAAIDAAQNGDVIGLTATIEIQADITLGNPNKHLTIRRNSTTAFFQLMGLENTNMQFQNITFDGGNAELSRCFFMIGCNVKFIRCKFTNIVTQGGGAAAYISSNTVTFEDCIFDNNKAVNGGHIALSGNADVTLKNCIMKNGIASNQGGAIQVSTNIAKLTAINCTITENNGNMTGGIANYGTLILTDTRLYNNTSVYAGADIGNYSVMSIQEDIDELNQIYANENIIVKGWVSDYQDETGGTFLRLDYELLPKEVILAESSLGVAGDSKITGLDSDKFYKVTTGETVAYSKADGTLILEESEAEKLTGTEIIGLTNGVTYKVEEYTPIPTPEPPVDPGDNDNKDPDPTPTPEPEKPKPDEPKPTPSPTPDKNDTTNNTTTYHDDSTVREDHSSTRNDYSGSNNTSTVHNYYTTEESKASSDESVVAVMAQPSPSPIYESVKSDTAPAETKPVEQEQKDDSGEATASTPKNIRIEANGADVVFELNEDGYNISINANSNNQEVKADIPVTSSTNWYEVAKIGLLAAIAFTLLWKPRKTIKNDPI